MSDDGPLFRAPRQKPHGFFGAPPAPAATFSDVVACLERVCTAVERQSAAVERQAAALESILAVVREERAKR
jgi:hypothetical protein